MKKGNRLHSNLSSNTPRIAIIGCGAFTELFYLPAFTKHQDVLKKLILVDKNEKQLHKLAASYNVANLKTDYRDILNDLDGAIVVVPHQLHYPITMDLLRKGIHVLCEKPLAESPDEAKEMISQAEKSSVTLSVNHTQRLFPANIKVKEFLEQRKFGKPQYMSYSWGEEFTWPTVSGFYFNTKMRKSGVLMDWGPHTLDLICWWLSRKPDLVLSENDSFGGIEAVAHIRLKSDDCMIDVKLNWLNKLSNSYTICYEQAKIEKKFLAWWQLPIQFRSGKSEIINLKSPERNYYDFGVKIVSNFIDVIRKNNAPLIPAYEVISSIELIQECYKKVQRFKLSWYDNLEVPNVSPNR